MPYMLAHLADIDLSDFFTQTHRHRYKLFKNHSRTHLTFDVSLNVWSMYATVCLLMFI